MQKPQAARLFGWLVATVLVWAVFGEAFAATVTYTGFLPRGLEGDRFTLTIVVKGGSELQNIGRAPPTDVPGLYKARLQIFLAGDTSVAIGTDPVAAQTSGPPFYVSNMSIVNDRAVDTAGREITYSVEITAAKAGALKEKATGGTLAIKISAFLEPQTTAIADKTDQPAIPTQNYYITDVPSFSANQPILGTMNQLVLSWDAPAKVKVEASPALDPQTPGQMQVFVLDPDKTGGLLAAKQYAASGDTKAPDCSFVPEDPDGRCIHCGSITKVYIDYDNAAGPMVTKKKAAVSDAGTAVTGLTNGKRYYLFLQYDGGVLESENGVSFARCLPGTPSENLTLTEFNGEGKAEVVDFRCFIATAAYGTPLHPDLRYFRKFRDRVLLRNPAGKLLVKAYYRVSPPLADFIAEHPRLRDLTRWALTPVAELLKGADSHY